MHYHTPLLFTLLLSPLARAHGRIDLITGNAGGNGTALGITGGIVPLTGRNSLTEVDTTVFRKTRIATDGLGRTTGRGPNKATDLTAAMAQAGPTLPQVSPSNGSISGTFHIITTDGAGPISAVIDTTATGAFAQGIHAHVVMNVPGKNGNMRPNGTLPRALHALGLAKRAANVNLDFPFQVLVPGRTKCGGNVAGQEKVCFMKIANSNKAGPFGGVVAFQMVDGDGVRDASVVKTFSA
ncbi:cell surface protein [Polyplosphaeria fusca]|uniref:Cell surface protein n=1 Tax=Polyplosphaeria fusca TaxID=682080 RepID=A0A9P4R2T9_9PLEO|nr:cell surface protein [Polyplosphaeria fusca]